MLLDAGQQGGALQQLFGQRTVGGVIGVKELETPPGMGSGDTGQELEDRIDHQLGQQLAGDIDRPDPGIPKPNQRKQLPLLVMVRTGD